MKLNGLVKANIAPAVIASQGRSPVAQGVYIPEIKSGVQATYTEVKSGDLFAREMTFSGNAERVEIEIDKGAPSVEANPFDSIASEFFASGGHEEPFVASEAQKAKAFEAYAHVSEA